MRIFRRSERRQSQAGKVFLLADDQQELAVVQPHVAAGEIGVLSGWYEMERVSTSPPTRISPRYQANDTLAGYLMIEPVTWAMVTC